MLIPNLLRQLNYLIITTYYSLLQLVVPHEPSALLAATVIFGTLSTALPTASCSL